MRHQRYNPDFKFVKYPENFNKYTDRELLQYCLGATMYMPGTKDFLPKILNCAMPGLTPIVFCFEDACAESEVPVAEENVLRTLDAISTAIDNGTLNHDDVPLIFCRVRNQEQFVSFSERLTPHMAKALTGINFPKFNSENGDAYFAHLKKLSTELGEILYGMPIIEDPRVAYKESRMQELMSIRAILNKYYDMVLQIRVGGTDFSSCFGVRRGVDYSIYDIMTVRECLVDILNVFTRNNEFRGDLPIGVKLDKRSGKYQARCNDGQRNRVCLGTYSTPEEAFYAYKEYKETIIKEIADSYQNEIPIILYEAMYNYEVEIND